MGRWHWRYDNIDICSFANFMILYSSYFSRNILESRPGLKAQIAPVKLIGV